MSWNPWMLSNPIPVLLFTTTALAWWTSPETARVNLIAASGILIFSYAVAPEFSQAVSTWLYLGLLNTTASFRLDLAVWTAKKWKMLVTGAAVIWLGRRAWQTLWKPVPELINILGVEVPDSPYVVLAGIRSDAATLNWTRPAANRPVQKFLIQVNGVNVGEVGPNQEPAIVVSGLKPDHFYNVRVIAVGSNNFQAGSQVVRLRTYGKDGRPRLGNGRLPSNFREDEHEGPLGEQGQENGGPRSFCPGLETAGATENGTSMTREGSISTGSGPRRNTVTRKPCPSATIVDHQAFREEVSRSEQSLLQLTAEFEKARRETEETMALIAKEDADNERLLEELENEKAERKKEREKKDAQTDMLRRDVNSTDREMRKAQNRRVAMEKRVKEKLDERAKIHDSMLALERKIRDSRTSTDCFEQRKTDAEEERHGKVECLRESLALLQDECAQMEAELKDKRDKVKELDDTRRKLPGGDEERDPDLRRHWLLKQRDLQEQLHQLHQTSKELEEQLRVLAHQAQQIPAKYEVYGQLGSSGLDVDHHGLMQLKRQSRASNTASNVSISSPLPPYSQIDPATLPTAHGGFSSSRAAHGGQGFAPWPFMDLSDRSGRLDDETAVRTCSVPLSPSAAALLPSNILEEFDEAGPSPSESGLRNLFVQQSNGIPADDDAQSPGSSTRSMSILSSPQGSCKNLYFPGLAGDSSERMSVHGPGISSHSPHNDAPHRLAHLFAPFQRARIPKGADEAGPSLGSLKHGQSNSFPRQTDETDVPKRKWTVFNRSSTGPDVLEHIAPTSQPLKSLIPFRSPRVNTLFSGRDSSSPRPASIASSELPRPSTESSGIWGPPDGHSNRFWPPTAWTRAPSRRPSLHGSPAALKTTLASENDEILQDEFQPDVSQVGVIGSRPPGSGESSFARLNPNAPAFRSFFKSKDTKDKDGKEAVKDKDRSKGKLETPEDSRQSRDSFSTHTMTSVSESYDSLSLDRIVSSTPSEALKDALRDEGVVRKLFRKGSSSKFSLPGRLGKESGLFKKGPGSGVSGELDDQDENGSPGVFLARSYDSMASSAGQGPTHSNAHSVKSAGKEGGSAKSASVRWLTGFSKKGRREKESLEVDRERERERERERGRDRGRDAGKPSEAEESAAAEGTA